MQDKVESQQFLYNLGVYRNSKNHRAITNSVSYNAIKNTERHTTSWSSILDSWSRGNANWRRNLLQTDLSRPTSTKFNSATTIPRNGARLGCIRKIQPLQCWGINRCLHNSSCRWALRTDYSEFLGTGRSKPRKKLLGIESRCEEAYTTHTRRSPDGRYTVPLLVDMEKLSRIGCTRGMAQTRFYAMERRLQGNPRHYARNITSLCKSTLTLGIWRKTQQMSRLVSWKYSYHIIASSRLTAKQHDSE